MNQPPPICFFVHFVCFVVIIRVLIPNSGCDRLQGDFAPTTSAGHLKQRSDRDGVGAEPGE